MRVHPQEQEVQRVDMLAIDATRIAITLFLGFPTASVPSSSVPLITFHLQHRELIVLN